MCSLEIGSIEVEVENSIETTSYESASKSEIHHSPRLSSSSDYEHDSKTFINTNNSNSMKNTTAMGSFPHNVTNENVSNN